MTSARLSCLIALFAAGALLAPAAARLASAQDEGVAVLLHELEAALQSGTETALEPLLSPRFDRAELREFRAGWYSAAITRAIVRERDRVDEGERRIRLVLEVLVEYEQTGRMLTWQAMTSQHEGRRVFDSLERVGSLEGLHRLRLDASRQYRARDFRVSAEDFDLVLTRGDVFLCRVPGGVTGLVIVGRGEMTFRPRPETEQRQLEIFSGDPELRTPFRAAFVRVHPAEYHLRFSEEALT